MEIIVQRTGMTIYQQVLEDSSTLNNTVAFLMQQMQGDTFVTKIINNGHELTFRNAELNIERLVRRVNGIVIRASRGTPGT
jgi:hypothetical protein